MGNQKADKDPTQWLPPATGQQCRYVGERVTAKLRWKLTVDKAELEARKVFADGPCDTTAVVILRAAHGVTWPTGKGLRAGPGPVRARGSRLYLRTEAGQRAFLTHQMAGTHRCRMYEDRRGTR